MIKNAPAWLHVRVFRVIDSNASDYCRSIVFEDIESGQFRERVYSCSTRTTPKARIDRQDALSVLNQFRTAWSAAQYGLVLAAGAYSIDSAVSQGKTRRQEALIRARDAESHVASQGNVPSAQESGRLIAEVVSVPFSAEEKRRYDNQVWRFSGGKRLRWKAVQPTGSGDECDVLTV